MIAVASFRATPEGFHLTFDNGLGAYWPDMDAVLSDQNVVGGSDYDVMAREIMRYILTQTSNLSVVSFTNQTFDLELRPKVKTAWKL